MGTGAIARVIVSYNFSAMKLQGAVLVDGSDSVTLTRVTLRNDGDSTRVMFFTE